MILVQPSDSRASAGYLQSSFAGDPVGLGPSGDDLDGVDSSASAAASVAGMSVGGPATTAAAASGAGQPSTSVVTSSASFSDVLSYGLQMGSDFEGDSQRGGQSGENNNLVSGSSSSHHHNVMYSQIGGGGGQSEDGGGQIQMDQQQQFELHQQEQPSSFSEMVSDGGGHPSASYHANFITQTIGSSADFPPGLLHHHHQPPGTPQQLHHPSQLLHHSPPPPDSGELISRPLEDHEDSSPATAVHLDIRQHPPPPSAAILDPSGLPGFIETYSTRQAFEAAQAAAQAAASASTSSAASQGGSGTSLNNNNSTTSTSGVPQPTTLEPRVTCFKTDPTETPPSSSAASSSSVAPSTSTSAVATFVYQHFDSPSGGSQHSPTSFVLKREHQPPGSPAEGPPPVGYPPQQHEYHYGQYGQDDYVSVDTMSMQQQQHQMHQHHQHFIQQQHGLDPMALAAAATATSGAFQQSYAGGGGSAMVGRGGGSIGGRRSTVHHHHHNNNARRPGIPPLGPPPPPLTRSPATTGGSGSVGPGGAGGSLMCAVCGDNAACQHYGVRTCEGCKGFFKRTVQKNAKYVCLAEKNCPVDKRRRNRCQFCRFQKCLNVGMVKEVVRTDSLKGRRGRLPSKPRSGGGGPSGSNSTSSSGGSSSGPALAHFQSYHQQQQHSRQPQQQPHQLQQQQQHLQQQQNFIVQLVTAHIETSPDASPHNLDYSYYIEPSTQSSDPDGSPSSFDGVKVQQFYNLLTSSIEVVRRFVLGIPGIAELLPEKDLDSLFTTSCLELFSLRLAYRLRPGSDQLVFDNGVVLHHRQCRQTFGDWTDSIVELSRALHAMDLDVQSMVCMCVLTLVNERQGLSDPSKAEYLETKTLSALRDHVNLTERQRQSQHQQQSPSSSSSAADSASAYLAKILDKLQALRAVSVIGMQRIFYLKLEDTVPAPPLIEKMFASSAPF